MTRSSRSADTGRNSMSVSLDQTTYHPPDDIGRNNTRDRQRDGEFPSAFQPLRFTGKKPQSQLCIACKRGYAENASLS